MENIIPLILFTYPGAISECVYRRLDKNRSGMKQNDEIIRVAWDFFLSALVTALCLVILHPGDGTLSDLMEAMKEAGFLWSYLAWSLGLGAVVGVAWFLLKLLCFRGRNWYLKKRGMDTYGAKRTVWKDLLDDSLIPHEKAIASVRKDGIRLRAGFIWKYTTDLASDPGLILMHTKTVEEELDRKPGEKSLIRDPVVSYIEPASGLEIQIYDGKALGDYIYDCAHPVTSSETAVAAESGE